MATKGHWPAGKRRNHPGPTWAKILIAVRTRLERPRRGTVSRRAIGRWCEVHDRTVRRWLRREDNPPPRMAKRVLSWLASVLTE